MTRWVVRIVSASEETIVPCLSGVTKATHGEDVRSYRRIRYARTDMLEPLARYARPLLIAAALALVAGALLTIFYLLVLGWATYAIGQVAKSWYASGRALDRADLEARFARSLDEGRTAFERVRESVEDQARTLSAGAR